MSTFILLSSRFFSIKVLHQTDQGEITPSWLNRRNVQCFNRKCCGKRKVKTSFSIAQVKDKSLVRRHKWSSSAFLHTAALVIFKVQQSLSGSRVHVHRCNYAEPHLARCCCTLNSTVPEALPLTDELRLFCSLIY